MARTSAELVRFAPASAGEDRLERWLAAGAARWSKSRRLSESRASQFVENVLTFKTELQLKSDSDLLATLYSARAAVLHVACDEVDEAGDRSVALCMAIVCEMASRRLGMRPFDVQLSGAWTLLNGMLAEMQTGEGKSLTAALAAAVAAIHGRPVHVVTVNDYLASRDSTYFRRLYGAIGLEVGCIQEGMDVVTRRQQYACDIVYCSNKELAFDYLRDRIAFGRYQNLMRFRVARLAGGSGEPTAILQRGLDFAIVDEADSVLIDEARVPLIIARERVDTQRNELMGAAVRLVRRFRNDVHFTVDRNRRPSLTSRGLSIGMARLNRGGRANIADQDLIELLETAVQAVHVMHSGSDYVVAQGKVQIVDEYTGRLMSDRSWQSGLHQMVEIKEGCELTAERETLARTSYQRFFPRFRHLSGMTGTAHEVAAELYRVYGLLVRRIPTHRPVRRKHLGCRVFAGGVQRDRFVVEAVSSMNAIGRPVLVGTRSIASSERLAVLLRSAGFQVAVLNAVHHDDEASIVAQAGQPGSITIATNMAGRGTDIALGPGVAAAGGLHVIATERHESRRIDRQLFGRAARQGDPGSCEEVLALDDELAKGHMPRALQLVLMAWARRRGNGDAGRLGRAGMAVAQWFAEFRHASQRKALVASDERMERQLAFSPGGRD